MWLMSPGGSSPARPAAKSKIIGQAPAPAPPSERDTPSIFWT
jgi:hypothetical protein